MPLYSHIHTALRFNIFSLQNYLFLNPSSGQRRGEGGWPKEGGGGREYVVLSLCVVVCLAGIGGVGGYSTPIHFLFSTLNLLFTFTGSGLNLSAAALVAELFYNVAQLLSVSHSCVSTTFSF